MPPCRTGSPAAAPWWRRPRAPDWRPTARSSFGCVLVRSLCLPLILDLGRVELARPGETVDVDTERVLAELVRGPGWLDDQRQQGRPALGRGEASVLKTLLDPFHLERGVGGPDDAGDLDRDTVG